MFTRKILSVFTAVFLVFGLAAVAHGVGIIVNGSFEESTIDPTLNVPVDSTGITGWVVTRDYIDYMDSTSPYYWLVWQASDGNRSIDLAGSPGMGGIAQTFSTDVGTQYLVAFDMAGNPTGDPTTKNMRVTAANQSADFIFDITGHDVNNMGWETKTWAFTANDTTTTLEFNNITASWDPSYGPALDNVRVNIVPEPSSVFLLATGLSGLALLRKRARRQRG